MLIDLINLKERAVILKENIEFTKEYFKAGPIKEIKNCFLTGKVYDDFGEIIISGFLSGIMVLEDTVTLEPMDFQFACEIDEIIEENSEYLEKNQNTLDIMGILWQNIVLEVPMRITKCESHENLKGEGWELKNNDSNYIDPRLSKLEELLDEEEGE